MYGFIVGGFLPGTDIQISFQAYLGLITVLFGIASITWIELKHRSARQHLTRLLRQPLHASQLHQRAL
jgi:hypothetical protein